MTNANPYRKTLKSLSDVAELSEYANAAYNVYLMHMETDSGHDDSHILRVIRNALWFGGGGDQDVIVTAAFLHDLVNLPKDSPNRKLASQLSAKKADAKMIQLIGYRSREKREKIFNAIEAHSWSANIEPISLEARAVQDADRIDALGYVGIARLFSVGGRMNRTMFHPTDPLAKNRILDEYGYTLDHYFVKLRHIPETMKTDLGKQEAVRLVDEMEAFLDKLMEEL